MGVGLNPSMTRTSGLTILSEATLASSSTSDDTLVMSGILSVARK